MGQEHMNSGVTILPTHVRENLKKYAEHENITCLECGYVGLMGVAAKTQRVSWAKSLTYFGIFAVIYLFFGIIREMKGEPTISGWWVLVVVVIGGVLTSGEKKIYECPNCCTMVDKK